jgi:hypothetical protein
MRFLVDPSVLSRLISYSRPTKGGSWHYRTPRRASPAFRRALQAPWSAAAKLPPCPRIVNNYTGQDTSLPRSAAALLRKMGHEAVDARDVGNAQRSR